MTIPISFYLKGLADSHQIPKTINYMVNRNLKTEIIKKMKSLMHNGTVMYNYTCFLAQGVSLFFTLKYAILRGKWCISDETKICPFRVMEMAEEIPTMISRRKLK